MPEQISKYPEVTLKVLKGAGAVCGEGVEQKILTQCPADRFCALPTGEVCVYGIEQIPQMTQITPMELARVVCPGAPQGVMFPPTLSTGGLMVIGVALDAGLVLGRLSRRSRRGRVSRDP